MAVVTISRQLGSGGDWIARRLAEETGYLLLDRPKLLFLLSEKVRNPGRVHLLEERAPAFLEHLQRARSKLDELAELALRELASRHDLIIVGRGGQVLYADLPGALHVRIVAPLPERVARLMADQGLSAEEARARIEKSDRDRAAFLRTRFGVEADDPSLYHLIVNTGRVPPEAAVRLLVQLLEALPREAETIPVECIPSSSPGRAAEPGGAVSASAAPTTTTKPTPPTAMEAAARAVAARAARGLAGPPVLPWPHQTTLGEDGKPVFAHPSEAEFARVLDFYGVRWEYEPVTFPLAWTEDGRVLEAFTPDFYLPDIQLFVELTTMKQSLVTKKNHKVRRLRELYPDLSIKVFYSRDYRMLLRKFGQDSMAPGPAPASGPSGMAAASASA